MILLKLIIILIMNLRLKKLMFIFQTFSLEAEISS